MPARYLPRRYRPAKPVIRKKRANGLVKRMK